MTNRRSVEGGRTEEVERTPVAHVQCDMARHSLKGKLPDGREPITFEGMRAAVQSRTGTVREHIGAILGSPRERTGQSSALRMFADQFKDVDFTSVDPEDIVRWLQEGGVQKVESPFLNFQVGEGEYHKEFMDEFNAKRYLKWIVERSDASALEHRQNPEKVTPFSVQAGNVGSFIVGEVWDQYDRLWNGKPEKKGVDFVTSHQAILESFLYKVIARKDGKEAADAFVVSLRNEGFKENQGLTLDVSIYDKDNTDDWTATVTYEGKQYVLAPDEVSDIITEGQALQQKLEEQFEAK